MTRHAAATRWGGDVDWTRLKRVLIVKLRSIGDTVLATPTLVALRRFLPDAQIDILLEDWVAPVLEGFEPVDNVITVSRKDTKSRLTVARRLRQANYDVAFNLHGGTTATFFVRASGAKVRVGFSNYSYAFLYTHLLSSSSDFWNREKTHSAEQQLALVGFTGVPVDDRPTSALAVTEKANQSVALKLGNGGFSDSGFALIHPVAAFDTKTWPTENFARVAEHLAATGLRIVAVATKKERPVLDQLQALSKVEIRTFDDLSLPEITALASKATIFVGNDSGIAHMVAAVETPLVVVFGSSNIAHWRPWTSAPHEVVHETLPCQPCAGYVCEEFGEPKCILGVKVASVEAAIDRLLAQKK